MSDQNQNKTPQNSETEEKDAAAEKAQKREEHKRRVLDDAIADTFPASDPVALEYPGECEEAPERNEERNRPRTDKT